MDHKEQVHYVGDSRVRAKRKKMYPPDYTEFPSKSEAFFPDFLLKEWMVAAVFLVGFMTVVMSEKPPLGDVADPTNTGFIPVPDWYFLFMYQLLKYKWASGPFVVIGTIVMPGLLFASLILVPWLDRSKERRPSRRPVTISIMVIAILGIAMLTWTAEDQHETQEASAVGKPTVNKKVIDVDSEGHRLYQQNACIRCHGDQLQGKNGPPLLGVGNRHTAAEITSYINQGKGGVMPAGMFQGTADQEKVLVNWLLEQKQK